MFRLTLLICFSFYLSTKCDSVDVDNFDIFINGSDKSLQIDALQFGEPETKLSKRSGFGTFLIRTEPIEFLSDKFKLPIPLDVEIFDEDGVLRANISSVIPMTNSSILDSFVASKSKRDVSGQTKSHTNDFNREDFISATSDVKSLIDKRKIQNNGDLNLVVPNDKRMSGNNKNLAVEKKVLSNKRLTNIRKMREAQVPEKVALFDNGQFTEGVLNIKRSFGEIPMVTDLTQNLVFLTRNQRNFELMPSQRSLNLDVISKKRSENIFQPNKPVSVLSNSKFAGTIFLGNPFLPINQKSNNK